MSHSVVVFQKLGKLGTAPHHHHHHHTAQFRRARARTYTRKARHLFSYSNPPTQDQQARRG